MAVMNVDRCFFCCLYGNNEEETIIREIRRDESYEEEMIFLEQYFWENHVLTRTPPPYTEDGDMGKSCKAVCQQDGVNYIVTYNPVRTPGIDKDNLIRLKLDHPDIYEQYVTVSESRRFSVKIDTKTA